MNKQIVPLFGIPILYIFDSSRRLSINEKHIIDNLEENDNQNHLSKNTSILELPGLEDLKKFCQTQINCYARELAGVSDTFFITNSWTARNERNIGHHKHTHPNSIFSGVYYFDAYEDSSPLTIHYRSPIFKDFALEYHYEKCSIFNSHDWSFPVKTGTIVVFPSWLEHSSEPNIRTEDRRLLGFNSFVKGIFGDFNYCSDLRLE